MEYEDTNILRTQYVDDLVNQRQALEDAMLYQESPVVAGEGLSTMIPKVQALTGAKPSIPYISFYNCNLYTLPNINFNALNPSVLNKVFSCAAAYGKSNAPLDLSNIVIFKDVTDFSYMFAGFEGKSKQDYKYIRLGKYFNLTNAKSIAHLFDYKWNHNTDRGLYVILYNIDEIPTAVCSNLEDVSGLCSSNNARQFATNGPNNLVYKIYGAKIKIMDAFFMGYEGAANIKYSDELDKILAHMYKYWDFSNLESLKRFTYGNFHNASITKIVNWFQKIPFNKVKDISYMFYYSTTNTAAYGTTEIDWSMLNFDSLETVNYAFHLIEFTKITLGPASKGTLKNIDYAFSVGYTPNLTYLSLPFWDLSKVEHCINCFERQSKLETLYFGLNLGKGFTYKSANYYNYTITLSHCNLLSVESVVYMFNQLYDLNLTYNVSGGGKLYTQKIDLHADVIAKLTPEEIAIATNKGWTVV